MKKISDDNSLRLYLRILSYFRPYIRTIFLVLLFNLLFVISNTVSVWMVAPLINTIFESEESASQQQIESEEAKVETNIWDLNQWLKLRIDKFFRRDSKVDTLKILCIFLFLAFFIKNLHTNGFYYLDNKQFPFVLTIFGIIGLLFSRYSLRWRGLILLWFFLFWGIFLFFYAGSYQLGADVRFALVARAKISIICASFEGSLAQR